MDTSSSIPACQTFLNFKKLPNEIQDIIWDFSIGPSVVEFQFVDPKHPHPGHGFHKMSKLRQSTQNRAIYQASKGSRARALAWRESHSYSLTLAPSLIGPGSEPWPDQDEREPFHFDYDPAQDTIYLPHYYELIQFCDYVQLAEKGNEKPHRHLAAVKSVALGGIFEQAVYGSPDSSAERQEIQICSPFHVYMRGHNLTDLIAPFHSIEELIITLPSGSEVERQRLCVPYARNWSYAMQPDGPNPDTVEKEIQKFKITLEAHIRKHPRLSFAELEENATKPRGSYSEWWNNPVVTIMTEGELLLRHGAERKIGVGNMIKLRGIFERARACHLGKPCKLYDAQKLDWKACLAEVEELQNVRALGYDI